MHRQHYLLHIKARIWVLFSWSEEHSMQFPSHCSHYCKTIVNVSQLDVTADFQSDSRRHVFIQSDLPCFCCHFHIPDQDKQCAIQHSPWSNASARLMGDDGPTSWSHKRTRKLLNISTCNQQKPGLYLTLDYNLVSKTIDLWYMSIKLVCLAGSSIGSLARKRWKQQKEDDPLKKKLKRDEKRLFLMSP